MGVGDEGILLRKAIQKLHKDTHGKGIEFRKKHASPIDIEKYPPPDAISVRSLVDNIIQDQRLKEILLNILDANEESSLIKEIELVSSCPCLLEACLDPQDHRRPLVFRWAFGC